MELLRSKKDELDVQLKDTRIYGTQGLDSGSVYSSTTFSVPRSLPTYQHTSRSTSKIVPRGLVSSVTMSAMQRPLSAVLSAASNGGSTMDLMSPEKLLGRSAKRLIIVSSGLNGLDPTIDLPPPSYQQKQAVRFLSNEPEGASPPRALMLDASTGQRRPLPISNGGDVTGLTPSTTRSPYTPTSGVSGSGGAHTPASGSSTSNSMQERPLKPRLATPYVSRGERERESLDRSTNSIPDQEPSTQAFEAPSPPTLMRPGYLTNPSIAALKKMSVKELSQVRNFSVYRPNIGRIEWEGETDVRGLDLDLIVNIEKRGVEVYDSEEAALIKPEVGFGLNKTAVIYLSNIAPPEGSSDLKKSQFLDKLKKICEKSGSEFVDYDASSGEWIFRVEHFSRYGLDDSDDEDEPEVTEQRLPVKKAPIVLSAKGKVQGQGQTPIPTDPTAVSSSEHDELEEKKVNEMQIPKYSLSVIGPDPADLNRMRLSFSQSSAAGQGVTSGIFSPRGFSATPTHAPSTAVSPMPGSQQASVSKRPSAAPAAVRTMPSPAVVSKNVISTETIAAVKEARSHPFHLTDESPCMQILLGVKKDYLLHTGQPEMNKKNVLTKVSGNGLPVQRVLQRRPADASLSMGRSFRVGWGPNGEIVHAGKLLFGAEDVSYGKSHRVTVEKVDTLRWAGERFKGDSPVSSTGEAPSLMDSCESSLKAILTRSFVFNNEQEALTDSSELTDEISQDSGSAEKIVPLWRAPYAKPWELKEYIPYLNILEDLTLIYDKRGLQSNHPEWAVGKAIELVSAVSGQERGSYSEAKDRYAAIGSGDKLSTGTYEGRVREAAFSENLESCRPLLDFIPLYEERDGHPPVDWERRREAISAWLVNITTVEGMALQLQDCRE